MSSINPYLKVEKVKKFSACSYHELHLMKGVSGKSMNELENSSNRNAEGTKFLNGFHRREDIQKCVYQGSHSYQGNQPKKLLEKCDILERDIKQSFNFVSSTEASPFLIYLSRFPEVVTSCFGQTLDSNYMKNIQKLSDTYRSSGISVAPKIQGDKKTCQLVIFGRKNTAKFTKICI